MPEFLTLEDLSNVIGTPVANTAARASHGVRPEIGQDRPATMRAVACQSLTYSMRTTPPERLRLRATLEMLKTAAHRVEVVYVEGGGREILRTVCGLRSSAVDLWLTRQ
jgi:hypothetical protein